VSGVPGLKFMIVNVVSLFLAKPRQPHPQVRFWEKFGKNIPDCPDCPDYTLKSFTHFPAEPGQLSRTTLRTPDRG
jgi:hypothetical protein